MQAAVPETNGEPQKLDDHEPYLVTKNQVQKAEGIVRKVWIRYKHPIIESSHVFHFSFKNLRIVTIEKDVFFEETICKNGNEPERVIGVARRKLSEKEKLNLTREVLTRELLKHYFVQGSPDTLHIEKSFHQKKINA